ncbi:unnamed protein product [Protopolystoma xenopodis]|uniref:Uncharacterized protein n=1 Tax=Protopolystoma xenopodis TaxID=117903 RepID=A0A3S5BB99_9PLAT|nr:unnamed protein product [Protopolystoma xenopodis]
MQASHNPLAPAASGIVINARLGFESLTPTNLVNASGLNASSLVPNSLSLPPLPSSTCATSSSSSPSLLTVPTTSVSSSNLIIPPHYVAKKPPAPRPPIMSVYDATESHSAALSKIDSCSETVPLREPNAVLDINRITTRAHTAYLCESSMELLVENEHPTAFDGGLKSEFISEPKLVMARDYGQSFVDNDSAELRKSNHLSKSARLETGIPAQFPMKLDSSQSPSGESPDRNRSLSGGATSGISIGSQSIAPPPMVPPRPT